MHGARWQAMPWPYHLVAMSGTSFFPLPRSTEATFFVGCLCVHAKSLTEAFVDNFGKTSRASRLQGSSSHRLPSLQILHTHWGFELMSLCLHAKCFTNGAMSPSLEVPVTVKCISVSYACVVPHHTVELGWQYPQLGGRVLLHSCLLS